jgi:hypothetical protein
MSNIGLEYPVPSIATKFTLLFSHIERILCDFHPLQEVQILVTNLISKYNATTDYTGFSRKLENYRSTLVSRYLGLR